MVCYDLSPIIQVKPRYKVSTNKIQLKESQFIHIQKGRKMILVHACVTYILEKSRYTKTYKEGKLQQDFFEKYK